MASRNRPSEQASSRTTNASTALPDYEPPSAPLTQAQRRALSQLPQTHPLTELSEHLRNAYSACYDNASAVNDTYHSKLQVMQGRRRKNDEEPEHESLEDMRQQVDQLTKELDSRVRGVVDGHETVAAIQRALQNVHNSTRETTRDEDAEMDETLAAHHIFKEKMASEKLEWEVKSMQERYANNNDYRGFKRLVHDSRHPGENAPPVPPTSTWFTDDPDVQEYDDDIAIESEKTSLKCPITLVTFNDPVTSTKCPHSFEREAILSMIQRSSARVGPGSMQRGRGTRAVQCPCCEQMLAVNDLKQDPILVRQVQRFKARQAREEESGEDEVGSNDESLVLMREAIGTAQATRIKKENMARRRTRQEDSEDEDSEDEES